MKMPGPMVLARAGTSLILLLKEVMEFWMIVSGCSFAAMRWVGFSHSSMLL